jgi:nucleotide-binding universal stress UspA family protein
MKKILVPVDFSKDSEYALLTAYNLAKQLDSELHLLHLIKTNVDWQKLSKEEERKYPETLEKIQNANNQLSDYKNKFNDVPTFVHLGYNLSLSHILTDINILKPDLVVISAYGDSGFNELTIGSVAKNIIRNAMCPVLTVKNKVHNNWKNICFASDFKEEKNYFTSSFIHLITELNAVLNLVFVNTPTYFQTTDLIELKMQSAIKTHKNIQHNLHIYNYFDVIDGVLSFADRTKTDVIAIATEGRKGLSRFFNPSLTEEIALRSEKPVLSFNFNS